MPRASAERRPGRLAAIIATGLLGAAQPAGAQIRVAPLEVARFQIGALQLTPTFEVRNLGVDANVFNDVRRRRDANVVLGPGLRAFLPVGERLRLGGRGRADLGWFTEESEERYVDLFGTSDAELDVGPFTLMAGVSGGRERQRFSIEIDDRIRRETRELRGGAGLRVGARTLLAFEGRTGRIRFDASTAQTEERGRAIRAALDRDTRLLRGELRYRLTDKTTLVVLGDQREDDFTLDPAEGSRARVYELMGGFDLASDAVISGRFRAGFADVPEDPDQAVPPWSGLAIDASLARNLTWFAQLRIDARRRLTWAVSPGRSAGGDTRNSFVDEDLAVQLSVGLPLDAVLRTRIGLERALFVLPVLQEGREVDRVDRRITVHPTLLWPIGRHLRLGVNAIWQRRTSNVRGVAYEGWRYGIAAEVVP